jgi:hypothetical protein
MIAILLVVWLVPQVDEATKLKALKCAYYLNGNSFGLRSDGMPATGIDVSKIDLDLCLAKAAEEKGK